MMKRVFKAITLILVVIIAFIGLKLIFATDEQRSIINDMAAYGFFMYEGIKEASDSTYTMDYSRVHHYIDRTIELSPTRANAYYSKALYYRYEDGDDGRAVDVYKEMAGKGLDFPYCAYMSGEAYDRLGVKDSAAYYYDKARRSYEDYLSETKDTVSFDYDRAVELKEYLDGRMDEIKDSADVR